LALFILIMGKRNIKKTITTSHDEGVAIVH
jgi:DHA1 family bicyclomycin/chloramphenicol resistance-like MFS transporter